MAWKMIHGDSRTAIPDQQFDLVVCSPPYNAKINYQDHDDALSLDDWKALITGVLSEAWDRLSHGGRMAVNIQAGVGRSPMVPIGHHLEAIGHGLQGSMYRGLITWWQGPTNTTAWGSWLSPSNPTLRGTYEHIHVWSKDSLSRSGGRGDMTETEFPEATLDLWHIGVEQSRGDHPAPFPVKLAERLIKLYSWPGDRVLDPFAGIGSSGVAAVLIGREWVGVDVSEEYCRIAEERLQAATEAPSVIEVELPDEVRAEATRFARVLAQGAHEAGLLEVKRVQLTHAVGDWGTFRRTLSNQVKIGAYGVVQKQDASRTFWVTGSGRVQMPTLRRWSHKPVRTIRAGTQAELEQKLLNDVAEVLVDASPDRRTRAVTARGFMLA